jgi:hypothetical protein
VRDTRIAPGGGGGRYGGPGPGQAPLGGGGYYRDFRERDPRDRDPPPPPPSRDNVGRDMGRERYMPPPPTPSIPPGPTGFGSVPPSTGTSGNTASRDRDHHGPSSAPQSQIGRTPSSPTLGRASAGSSMRVGGTGGNASGVGGTTGGASSRPSSVGSSVASKAG